MRRGPGGSILRDAGVGGQCGEHATCPAIPLATGARHERAVSELAPRARRLCIVMQMQTAKREQLLARRHAPDEVDHGRIAERARRTERQSEYRAQMILELTRRRALDRPVTRVMHPRRHFVGEQPSALHKKFDGEDTDIAKMLEHPREVAVRKLLPGRGAIRGARQAQYALRVHVAAQWIDGDFAARAPRADDSPLVGEGNALLVEKPRLP